MKKVICANLKFSLGKIQFYPPIFGFPLRNLSCCSASYMPPLFILGRPPWLNYISHDACTMISFLVEVLECIMDVPWLWSIMENEIQLGDDSQTLIRKWRHEVPELDSHRDQSISSRCSSISNHPKVKCINISKLKVFWEKKSLF